MLPFFLIFLFLGLGMLHFGRKLEREARLASLWPVTTGQLEHCEVVQVPGIGIEDPSSWELRLRYAYAVNGRSYHSTRYAFGYGDGRDDAPHRRIADALRRSPQLTVHYNPARPSEAVLSTAVPGNLTNLAYSMLVMAAICGLIWLTPMG